MNFSIIIYGIIGYLVYDMFLKGKSQSDEFEDSFGNAGKLSYPLYAYKEMTSKLLNAMHGNMTDEEPIYDVFRTIKTEGDAIQLKKEFGLRPYTGNMFGSFGLLINDEVPLTTWLDNELEDDEKQKVRTILKNNNVKEYFV